MARTIPEVAKAGAQVFLTANDHDFGKLVWSSSHRIVTADRTERWHVLPATGDLPLTLCEFREDIEKKRKAFESEENNHAVAQGYLNELRIYIEAQLPNLFDIPDPAMPPRPTLAELINAIRRRVNKDMEPFSGQVFHQLVNASALQDGSEFLRLVNESHHGRAHLITYNDVAARADECKRVLDLAHAVAEEYERWLRRAPLEAAVVKPAPFPPGKRLSFSVPLILATAAAGRDSPIYEIVEDDSPLTCDWLDNHAIYANNTSNLGFAGSKNCRLLVDVNGNLPEDHTSLWQSTTAGCTFADFSISNRTQTSSDLLLSRQILCGDQRRYLSPRIKSR